MKNQIVSWPMRIDHIGIAVKDLEQSVKTFETILNRRCDKRETVESEGVETAFFQAGESKVELLGALHEDSVIRKYVEKRGEGLHHVAFEVEDLEAELARLKAEGYRVLNEEPKQGADNKWVAFLHPKDANGVLLELCQTIRE